MNPSRAHPARRTACLARRRCLMLRGDPKLAGAGEESSISLRWPERSIAEAWETNTLKWSIQSCGVPFYLPRRRRPGTGDIATPPVRPSVCLSVCLSVCPSVTFSFLTVTQKRIDVFSRNFAGMCTMSWGCAV